jgi:hypothetical protein
MSVNNQLDIIAADRFEYVASQAQEGADPAASVDSYNNNLLAMVRDQSARDVTSMPWLPQLPETWAQEIHDRIEARERELVAPNLSSDDYEMGTATYPDEVKEINGQAGNFLFTAEHATEPVRFATKKRETADVGTGGLAAVLAEDYGNALIMLGDQTSNAPIDPDHAIKPYIAKHITGMDGFVSVHGMAGGKFVEPTDRTEVQAVLGLGAKPTEAQREYAEKLVKAAKDIGLYVIVGSEYYIQKPNSHELKPNEKKGGWLHGPLNAERPTSTTNFVQDRLPNGVFKPAFQIELTRFLRLTPYESDKRDRVSRVIGVALGYKLLHSAVELAKV